MESSSDKLVQELKEIMEKDSGKEVTWDEAAEASRNLAGFAQLLFDIWVEEQKRERKLKEFPKGYQLEGSYSCGLCGGSTRDGNWFDRWGIKCLICQAAIDREEVPAWAVKHHDSWYSKYDLESRFNLKAPALKRWIKEGIIKPRNVTRDAGRVHVQIFLLCDNKDFLPPKRLTKSEMVKEEKDGKSWFRSEPWYRFVDPFEHLKDYRIMEHMRRTPETAGID